MRRFWLFILTLTLILVKGDLLVAAKNLPIASFPLADYIKSSLEWQQQVGRSTSFNTPLVSLQYQQLRFTQFKSHYFGLAPQDQSPWSVMYIQTVLKGANRQTIYQLEFQSVADFFNQIGSGYGTNYLAYDNKWINAIRNNMQLSLLKNSSYKKSQRAIATDNLTARVLPTPDPWFLSYTIAGEGYPFDHLQIAQVSIGTPLYIISESQDKAWDLVITPYFLAWVKAIGVARADDNFINNWSNLAHRALIAIIKPNLSLINKTNILLGIGYPGTVLPLSPEGQNCRNSYSVFVPVRTVQGTVNIETVVIPKTAAVLMPLTATAKNFLKVIKRLENQTYGWGGYLNYYDCSTETQAIFIPFGYFLLRNSAQQQFSGQVINLADQNPINRLNYIIKYSQPFMTIIYVKGHVMLYITNIIFDHHIVPLTYQDMWSLYSRNIPYIRYVIGKSLFFPLLLTYAAQPDAQSQLARPDLQLIFLDQQIPQINMIDQIYPISSK